MSSSSGDQTPAGPSSARTASLPDADRALLLASVAWRDRFRRPENPGRRDETVPEFLAGFRDRIAPVWLETLRGALERARSVAGSKVAPMALDDLRKMHQASARVDLRRVHPSWWVRALREESPAVQRLVAASLASSFRDHLQAGLLLDSQDLVSERAAAPEVVSWVMALWTERLVGGEAERADDSPALIVLSRLSPRAGYRLCRLAGFCKLILAGQPRGRHAGTTEQAREEWLTGRLADADADLRTLARLDVESSRSSKLPPRHRAARIGLATIARLLADSEQFRLRWALQHWPYPIAKLIRSLIPSATNRPAALIHSETWILKTAWDRLNLERRLVLAWPESNQGSDLP
jgi:hypothetical protein